MNKNIPPPTKQLDGVSPHADATMKHDKSELIHPIDVGGGIEPVIMLPVIHAYRSVLLIPEILHGDATDEHTDESDMILGMIPLVKLIPGGLLHTPLPAVPHDTLVWFRSKPENRPVTAIPIHVPGDTTVSLPKIVILPFDGLDDDIDAPGCNVPAHCNVKGNCPAPQLARYHPKPTS